MAIRSAGGGGGVIENPRSWQLFRAGPLCAFPSFGLEAPLRCGLATSLGMSGIGLLGPPSGLLRLEIVHGGHQPARIDCYLKIIDKYTSCRPKACAELVFIRAVLHMHETRRTKGMVWPKVHNSLVPFQILSQLIARVRVTLNSKSSEPRST